MPNDRFFIDQPLEENVEVFLENDEFVHLSRVMRAQKGDIVELVNGRYALAEAKITEMRPKSAALLVAKITKQLPKTTKLILA